MSPNVDIKTKKKKASDYSRRGCLQCKKSHLKCDEKSPTCSRCLKRKTKCSYFTNFLHPIKPEYSHRKIVTKADGLNINSTAESHTETSAPISNSSIDILRRQKDKSPTTIEIINQTEKTSPHTISTANVFSDTKHSDDLDVDSIHQQSINKNHSDASPFLHSPNTNRIAISPNDLANLLTSSSFLPMNYISPHTNTISDSSDFGSQLSEFNISINDLISFNPDDITHINCSERMSPLFNDTIRPNLNYFGNIPWDGGLLYYFVEQIKAKDPITINSSTTLSNQDLIDFSWSLASVTKVYYMFTLYSETSLISIFDLLFKLNAKSSIFQSVIIYQCSVHMVRLYNSTDEPELAQLWDTNVRIPSFKVCIDYLKEGLENIPDFLNLVMCTFAVAIIFTCNTSDESWRVHLNGCHQLISKASLLRKNVNSDDPFENASLKLYDIVVEWYNHISTLAILSSTNGFLGRHLPVHKDDSYTNIAIASNGINLMSGSCSEINIVTSKMCHFLSTFQHNGVNLSGLNFVHLILNDNTSVETINEIRDDGFELIHELKKIENSYKYKRSDSDDFKMDLTMKYCNMLCMTGFQLYVKYFFIGIRESKDVRPMLRDVLDLVYSMPYRTSCAIICHWIIFMATLISLLIEDYEIYGYFMGILRIFQMNGQDIKSMDIMERIKMAISEKDYEKLLLPINDFIIY